MTDNFNYLTLKTSHVIQDLFQQLNDILAQFGFTEEDLVPQDLPNDHSGMFLHLKGSWTL